MRLQSKKNIRRVKFGIYTPDEIKQISVVEIKQNRRVGEGSIYDSRMGPNDNNPCTSCKLNIVKCPGHYGHIVLARPIFHPLFFSKLESLLRLTCFSCYKCIFYEISPALSLSKKHDIRFFQLLDKLKKTNYCSSCNFLQPELKTNVDEQQIVIDKTELSPAEIYFIISNIDDVNQKFIGLNIDPRGLIIFNLLVLPNSARPMLKAEDMTCDDDLTIQYLEILKTNCSLVQAIVDKSKEEQTLFSQLKQKIFKLFNNSATVSRHCGSHRPFKSLYERISGKEGQFRKHAMSKRADKTARTVISPNPTLKLDELGVPAEIASTLTIPEIISPFNFNRLEQDYLSGKISSIQKKGNSIVYEVARYKNQGEGKIELGDICWRSLKDGDWVLFNRQPTLHAPSMQGMKIKICNTKTFNFNLANCKVYNADMDGDEMNIHVPQSIEAIVELSELSSPKNWLVSNAHGGVNFGLIQDALLGCYLMSFDREPIEAGEWYQFLNFADVTSSYILSREKELVTQPKFCAANILSCLFPHDFNYKTLNLEIINGEIISGKITKTDIGYENRGMFLSLINQYGKDKSCSILNNLQFVCVNWLSSRGYSISIRDCKPVTCLSEIKKEFRKKYDSTQIESAQIREIYVDQLKDTAHAQIKSNMKKNNILGPVDSGSKGNWVNLAQISGMVGQQYIAGMRPHVIPGESMTARGFIFSSYYEGLTPIETWGHLIAARDAVCKTAMGTATTGYQQRKLIKACENQIYHYDGTIRSNKKILSFPS